MQEVNKGALKLISCGGSEVKLAVRPQSYCYFVDAFNLKVPFPQRIWRQPVSLGALSDHESETRSDARGLRVHELLLVSPDIPATGDVQALCQNITWLLRIVNTRLVKAAATTMIGQFRFPFNFQRSFFKCVSERIKITRTFKGIIILL